VAQQPALVTTSTVAQLVTHVLQVNHHVKQGHVRHLPPLLQPQPQQQNQNALLQILAGTDRPAELAMEAVTIVIIALVHQNVAANQLPLPPLLQPQQQPPPLYHLVATRIVVHRILSHASVAQQPAQAISSTVAPQIITVALARLIVIHNVNLRPPQPQQQYLNVIRINVVHVMTVVTSLLLIVVLVSSVLLVVR
jgi:hypothetical protein